MATTEREAEKRTEYRSVEERALDYMTKSPLKLDKQLKKHFENEGWHLGWIRYLAPGTGNTVDQRNIAKKRREGWQFIKRAMLPEEFRDDYDVTKIGSETSIICEGDLILGRIKIELWEAKQANNQSKSEDLERSARFEANRSTGNSRMDKYLPVEDKSETTGVTTRIRR